YAVFTVTLSNVSDRYVTIIYGTTDGTATQDTSDYTAVVGSVLFGPGDTVRSVSVPIGGDSIDELDETFFLNLTDAVNAVIGDGQGVGTILDNDTASIAINDASV